MVEPLLLVITDDDDGVVDESQRSCDLAIVVEDDHEFAGSIEFGDIASTEILISELIAIEGQLAIAKFTDLTAEPLPGDEEYPVETRFVQGRWKCGSGRRFKRGRRFERPC